MTFKILSVTFQHKRFSLENIVVSVESSIRTIWKRPLSIFHQKHLSAINHESSNVKDVSSVHACTKPCQKMDCTSDIRYKLDYLGLSFWRFIAARVTLHTRGSLRCMWLDGRSTPHAAHRQRSDPATHRTVRIRGEIQAGGKERKRRVGVKSCDKDDKMRVCRRQE